MYIKFFILSLALITLVMLAFGIKLLFNKKATFTYGGCESAKQGVHQSAHTCACGSDTEEQCQSEIKQS